MNLPSTYAHCSEDMAVSRHAHTRIICKSQLRRYFNWPFSGISSLWICWNSTGIISSDWSVEILTSLLFWSSSFIRTNEKGNMKLLGVEVVTTIKNWWKQRSSINNWSFKRLKLLFFWLRFKKAWFFHLPFLCHNLS